VIDKAAQDIAEAIDKDLLAWLYTNNGWTPVTVDFWKHREEDMQQWCKEHLSGNSLAAACVWVFENKEDATLFALKWT
jgi:hypothetical protein